MMLQNIILKFEKTKKLLKKQTFKMDWFIEKNLLSPLGGGLATFSDLSLGFSDLKSAQSTICLIRFFIFIKNRTIVIFFTLNVMPFRVNLSSTFFLNKNTFIFISVFFLFVCSNLISIELYFEKVECSCT